MTDRNGVLNILVVEDHIGDYILIEEYLSEEHLQINLTRATTFKEAKDNLNETNSFGVIILDLSLPDVDDNETLVTQMVALAPNTPIIVLTGFASKAFGVKTLSLGISDYLLKDDLNSSQLAKSIYYSIERKNIDYRLSESERKYKALFDFSPLPMWVLDKHTLEFLNVNDAAVSLYGYSKEEFLTMNVRDLWTQDTKSEIESTWRENYHSNFGITVKHHKKNGELVHMEIKSNPIDFDGKEARVTQAKDITAQLDAEQALKHSEKRFKALVQDASDLIMIMDFSGDLSYVSPSALQMTGISDSEMIKNNFFHFIHKNDVKNVKTYLLKLKDNKRVQIPSYRIKTSDNKWRYIETIVTNLNDDSSINGLVANSRDITEFIKQEKKLIHSLKRYDIVAKATSDTITDYDVANDRMYYNEGIESIFGYSKNEIENTGCWWNDKLHPEDKLRVQRYSKQVQKLRSGHIQIEYRFRCADGSYKYVLDRSYLITDENGNPIRIIGAMQDITEIQNYIQTIENHNSRLKDIAWTQSHVVRAPLARIMGLIDLIQSYPNIDEQAQLLEHINTSATELDGIIRNITSKTEDVTLTSR
ncbi:PAS domain S-box-containing protein [Gillisia mitskevichiae]|uniref:histidine kinase n=1 Tax=Gillisia mitskevichiae TaxID=270921 RepID=A0A495PM84_9FLAO|nr:PAS domain S-box protein [Gillisia mitskevichiae]RKS50562.1 PAS domain S-box-containing protein [Gillisia mitskevichiae]